MCKKSDFMTLFLHLWTFISVASKTLDTSVCHHHKYPYIKKKSSRNGFDKDAVTLIYRVREVNFASHSTTLVSSVPGRMITTNRREVLSVVST
jgi:hypothetical protein